MSRNIFVNSERSKTRKMSQTEEKLLDIFYFETDKDITFYSSVDDTKLTIIKSITSFNEFQKIKDKYNFIALI